MKLPRNKLYYVKKIKRQFVNGKGVWEDLPAEDFFVAPIIYTTETDFYYQNESGEIVPAYPHKGGGRICYRCDIEATKGML